MESPATVHVGRINSTRWVLDGSADSGTQLGDVITNCVASQDASDHSLTSIAICCSNDLELTLKQSVEI